MFVYRSYFVLRLPAHGHNKAISTTIYHEAQLCTSYVPTFYTYSTYVYVGI